MFRRLGCVAVAVVTFVVMSALTAGGAGAEAAKPWPPASCATGKLTHATRDSGGGKSLLVHGEASACPRFLPGSEFAVVVFSKEADMGVHSPRNIRKFYPESARRFAVSAGGLDVAQVCLMSAPSRRLACAEVREVSGSPVLIPLRTDDPLITKPFEFVSSGLHPTCGDCF